MGEDAAIRVSDTTAITNLAAVGGLDLLESIFRHVLIPEAVYQELTAHADGVPGAREVRSSLWIEVRGVRDGTLVHRLRRSLDLGEAEANPARGSGSGSGSGLGDGAPFVAGSDRAAAVRLDR